MTTHVLVTGGAGFVGSHVVDRLVDEGYRVTVVDSLVEQVHESEPEYLNPGAEYVWGDVGDRDLMTDLLESADVLNHQASVVGVGQSMYNIVEYVQNNTLGTAEILDIVINEEINLEKIVVASSMSIYGEGAYYCEQCGEERYPARRDEPRLRHAEWSVLCGDCDSALDPRPTSESVPMRSQSVYATTKRDQEELSLAVGRSYGIPVVALRYFNIYGSRQALDNPYTGVCAIFSSRIKNENPPLVFEDGQQTRDFVHVSDVARANQVAIETSGADGHAVNIGTGRPKTISTVGRTLLDLYGKRDSLDLKATNEFRAGDIRHCYADVTRARTKLDFEPEVEFEDGMRELVAWGQEQQAKDSFNEAHKELDEKGLVKSEST